MYSLTNKITVFLEFPSNITYLPNRLVGVPKLHYIEKEKKTIFYHNRAVCSRAPSQSWTWATLCVKFLCMFLCGFVLALGSQISSHLPKTYWCIGDSKLRLIVDVCMHGGLWWMVLYSHLDPVVPRIGSIVTPAE